MDPRYQAHELPTATPETGEPQQSDSPFDFAGVSDDELLGMIHEEGGEVDSSINRVLLTVVGGFVFREEPEVKERYINDTAPILDVVGFHTCFGILGQLTPGIRLAIGLLAIVGMAMYLKWELNKAKEDEKEKQKKTPEKAVPDAAAGA